MFFKVDGLTEILTHDVRLTRLALVGCNKTVSRKGTPWKPSSLEIKFGRIRSLVLNFHLFFALNQCVHRVNHHLDLGYISPSIAQ